MDDIVARRKEPLDANVVRDRRGDVLPATRNPIPDPSAGNGNEAGTGRLHRPMLDDGLGDAPVKGNDHPVGALEGLDNRPHKLLRGGLEKEPGGVGVRMVGRIGRIAPPGDLGLLLSPIIDKERTSAAPKGASEVHAVPDDEAEGRAAGKHLVNFINEIVRSSLVHVTKVHGIELSRVAIRGGVRAPTRIVVGGQECLVQRNVQSLGDCDVLVEKGSCGKIAGTPKIRKDLNGTSAPVKHLEDVNEPVLGRDGAKRGLVAVRVRGSADGDHLMT